MEFENQWKNALEKRKYDARSAESSAFRLFHGHGEGEGFSHALTIDKFAEHAWVNCEIDYLSPENISELTSALQESKFKSAVIIYRKRKGDETQPAVTLFGDPPEDLIVENCGLKFLVNLKSQRQPGLFLDLDYSRNWLTKNSKSKNVLNLFSYTGSLSVAAGAGGASHVTSIDLSKNYTEWAAKNWKLNELDVTKADYIYGDALNWLDRFKKQSRTFDIVVCDPPSFSRTKESTFSTMKDLGVLHEKIFRCLSKNGVLVSSVNTETLSRDEFIDQIKIGAKEADRKISIESEFSLPPEFPIRESQDRYLKGAVIRATN
jgi:23S rRNA (cytosine1962-C5)-methyltransferase